MGYKRRKRSARRGAQKKSPIEEQIAEAMAQGEFDNLPGQGKPYSLEAYFSVPPHLQVSTQLLLDHKALPRSLQDRKDVEDWRRQAEAVLVQGAGLLETLHDALMHAAAPLVALFPDRATLLETLALGAWPSYFPEPDAAARRWRIRPGRHIQTLRRLIDRYNLQVEWMIRIHRECLQKANEQIRRLNLEVMGSGPVVGGSRLQMPRIDIDAQEREARRRFPCLAPLPEDAEARITAYLQAIRRPWHIRLIDRLRR